jgi:cell division protein FtsQ
VSSRSAALRRRRKRSLATRLRVLWVFIVVIIGALAYTVYLFVTLPALRVGSVDVQIAGLSVSEADVLRAAEIDRAANVWLLDTTAIARRIEAIPYVDTAIVSRQPPAHVTITVTQREPVACVHSGALVVTVDARRRVLQAGCARTSALQLTLRDTPLGAPGTTASAPALNALLADGRQLRAADVAVRWLGRDAYGGLVAIDAQGIDVLFGSDADLAQKAKLVAPILAAAQSGRRVRALDLRASTTPTIEYR